MKLSFKNVHLQKYLCFWLLSTATGTTAERAELSWRWHKACRGKVTNNPIVCFWTPSLTVCSKWRGRWAVDRIMKLYYETATIIITAWAGQTCYVSFSRKWAGCTLRWWRQSVRCRMLRLPHQHPGTADLCMPPNYIHTICRKWVHYHPSTTSHSFFVYSSRNSFSA